MCLFPHSSFLLTFFPSSHLTNLYAPRHVLKQNKKQAARCSRKLRTRPTPEPQCEILSKTCRAPAPWAFHLGRHRTWVPVRALSPHCILRVRNPTDLGCLSQVLPKKPGPSAKPSATSLASPGTSACGWRASRPAGA